MSYSSFKVFLISVIVKCLKPEAGHYTNVQNQSVGYVINRKDMFCAKAGSFVFHSFTFFVFVHFQLCQQHVLSVGLFSMQTLVMTTALHKDGLGGGGGGCLCLCRLVMTTVLRQGGGCLCVSVQTLVTTTVSYKDRLVMVCVSVRADSGDDHSIKTGWWWSVSVQTLVMTTVLRQGGGGLCLCRLW